MISLQEQAARLLEQGFSRKALNILAQEDETDTDTDTEEPTPEKGELEYFVTEDKAKEFVGKQLAQGLRVYRYSMPKPLNKGYVLLAAENSNDALSMISKIIKGADMDGLEEIESIGYFDGVIAKTAEVNKDLPENVYQQVVIYYGVDGKSVGWAAPGDPFEGEYENRNPISLFPKEITKSALVGKTAEEIHLAHGEFLRELLTKEHEARKTSLEEKTEKEKAGAIVAQLIREGKIREARAHLSC